jgi:hypothetical protein
MGAKISKTQGGNGLAEDLRALLGRKVLVSADLHEPVFCMSFQARVIAIEAVPDTLEMILHFDAGESLSFPYERTTACSTPSARSRHKALRLMLQILHGPSVTIEEISPRR